MFQQLYIQWFGETSYKVFMVLFELWPFWVTALLAYILYDLYMDYIQSVFIKDQGEALLEIKIPKEMMKSPAAMEVVLATFFLSGPANKSEEYLDGKVKPWFSLEMVSIGGQVKFYIWTQKKFKALVEHQIYSQYPTVEITEVKEDYVNSVDHDPNKYIMWGTYFKLAKPDPYPIKTYIDYGLGDDPKEELKVDPLAAVLEYLGSIKEGEQIWIQILIKGVSNDKLKEEAEEIIAEIREKATVKQEGTDYPGFPNPTKGQVETIAAIERSLGKINFECAMRGFYIAEKEAFNSIAITGLIGSVRQYNSNTLNGFKLGWYTDISDMSKDIIAFTKIKFLKNIFRGIRDVYERRMLSAYKKRSFFYPPYKYYKRMPFTLSTEELATIYHFPGQVAGTPTFERVMSKKAEAPANLPI